jgi:hypothetical protein
MGFRRRGIHSGDPFGRTSAQAKACGSGLLVRRGFLCRGLVCRGLVWHRFVTGACLILPLLAICGCNEGDATDTSAPKPEIVQKPTDILVFPPELHVKDESANRFLTRAMKTCGDGEYESFRSLWSILEQPLPRGDFDQGWQAVQEIRIRAFQQVFLERGRDGKKPEGETVYVVFADVSLDPSHRAGEREPHREVALMLVREKDEWRLAKAPAKMRKWVKNLPGQSPPKKAIDATIESEPRP